LYLDGAEQKGVAVIAPTNPAGDPPLFAFSPDGRHVAHHGFVGTRDKQGLVVNGKLVGPMTQLYRAADFTPDGQHVFCFSQNPGGGVRFALLVDGKRTLDLDHLPFTNPAVVGDFYPARMGADGVFEFVAASGGLFKRYRVTADAGSSLASTIAAPELVAQK
jgi:hypothetical protein